jgi:two-component system sensor histidine kinase AgrC
MKLVYNHTDILFDITMAFITMWIIYKYLSAFFEKKKNKLYNKLIWTLFYVFQVAVEHDSGNASIWILVINVVLVSLIAVIGFHKAGNKKVLYVVLLYVFWMIIELFCYNFLKLLPVGNMEFATLGSGISKLIVIMLVSIMSIRFRSKDKTTIPTIYYLLMLFIPVSSAFIVHNIFLLGGNDHKIAVMITLNIILLINLIIFEIYGKLAESFVIQKENIIYEQQIELLAMNTDDQKRAMDNFYKEKHNLINQLILLRENVKYGRNEDAINDLNHLLQISSEDEKRILNSGNNVIDTLINFKYSYAKKMGIDFKIKSFIPEDIPIQQSDLSIILGNSLDNAIEATRICDEHKRTIQIYMGIKKRAFVLVIINPYNHTLKWDDRGNLKTTKKENASHGYGVSFIRKTVEKYQGSVNVETENGVFTLTVILNI